ncbi:MAG: TolC family protein [Desulfotignum sp.]
MKSRCFILFFFLTLVCCPAVFAKEGDRYTLKALCRAANENAETIQIAADDVFIAEQEKKRALSVLVPRATVFGSHIKHKDKNLSTPDTTSAGMKLTHSFTINGKELIAYDVTKKGIDKTIFTLESIRSEYLFQVAMSYFEILRAKRLKQIAEVEVERLETHKASVKEKLRVGSVTKTDLFRAEAELSRARSDLVTARNAVIQNKARIVRLTGIQAPFFVSDQDIHTWNDFAPTLSRIQAEALENRFEIKEAKKNLEIAAQTIRYEKGDFWPKLNLETGYRETDISYDSRGLPGNIGGLASDTEDTYVQAELVFTLYDGGLRRAQVRQAMASERQAKQALQLVENDIVLESKISFSEYETAKNTLINLQDELTSAKENYSAVEMQYQYGMADIINMMDANTLLVQAQQRISNAQYTLHQAILKILYTQGDLLTHLLG